jgi:hypothetical protein
MNKRLVTEPHICQKNTVAISGSLPTPRGHAMPRHAALCHASSPHLSLPEIQWRWTTDRLRHIYVPSVHCISDVTCIQRSTPARLGVMQDKGAAYTGLVRSRQSPDMWPEPRQKNHGTDERAVDDHDLEHSGSHHTLTHVLSFGRLLFPRMF